VTLRCVKPLFDLFVMDVANPTPEPMNDAVQLILNQLQEIRLSNDQLRAVITNQEAVHQQQMAALRQEFEDRLAAQQEPSPTPVAAGSTPDTTHPTSGTGGSTAEPPAVPASTRPQLSERIPDPPMFSGKKKDLPLFLTKLQMKLKGNADRYPTAASRLIYAHSRLDTDPASLIDPLMNTNITTVEQLIEFLESTYGDPNKELTAWSRLDNLKQGKKNFLSHFANFRQIIADANLNESAQISQLRRSLSDNIREKMAGVEIPNTLDAYANLIQRYDNDLRYLPSSRAPANSRTTRYPVEMEIDAAGSSAYAPKNSAERQKRIKEGRCFKCGQKGHISTHCPDPNSKQQVRTSSTRHHDNSDSDSDSDSSAPSRPSQSRGRASRSRSTPSGKGPSRG
jgi:hypothetical protein